MGCLLYVPNDNQTGYFAMLSGVVKRCTTIRHEVDIPTMKFEVHASV